MTFARTGRSMKNFAIMACPICGVARRLRSCSCGSTFWPGIARSRPPVTTRSSAFRPFSITRRLALQRPGLHLALLDDIVGIDDEHIASALIAAERNVRHEQRIRRLSIGATRTRTK